MDAKDDTDVKLQRACADLLADLHRSLPIILWKTSKSDGSTSTRRVRRWVRNKDIDKLIKLLEPFQEWPQLLDPHLANLLPQIIDAFLECILAHQGQNWLGFGKDTSGATSKIPAPRAICNLLYTFCKIRGEKVISRFLNNEPKYLEPLLSSFEAWDNPQTVGEDASNEHNEPMIWYERYVILLWVSHLLLAPFDLASISSTGHQSYASQNVLGEEILSKLPGITRRLLPICFKYLVSASKEREATRTLLVRLCLRPDMRKLGLLHALMDWASTTLEVQPSGGPPVSIFQHIGVLSFITGVFVSADKDVIGPFLLQLFQLSQRILTENNPTFKVIRSSALARKTLIKMSRLITVLALQPGKSNYIAEDGVSQILEDVVDQLLTALADKDTPVRYAASKALSVITTALEPEMAAEVVEAVIGSMQEDILGGDETRGVLLTDKNIIAGEGVERKRNFGAVNPLKWHGLTLTLAHMLFRRSAAPKQLPDILDALILALEFEQRSSSSSSIGTNVRDSACFGIWSLARRYNTAELASVECGAIHAANRHGKAASVLQVLATEMTIAGTLDPSGNIRRGSSAALQELIGRHPDTIIEGISIVQAVDYHAVALRSRSVMEVSIDAAKLGEIYWEAMFDGLLGWRGVGSPDSESRRLASRAIGLLSIVEGKSRTQAMINRILEQILRLQSRGIEERHGLLLSLAEIVECSRTKLDPVTSVSFDTHEQGLATIEGLWNVFDNVLIMSEKDFVSASLRPELTAEAVCRLISTLAHWTHERSALVPSKISLYACTSTLSLCLGRSEEVVIESAAKAANDLFPLLTEQIKAELVQFWISSLTSDTKARSLGGLRGFGHLAALGAVFAHFLSEDDSSDRAIVRDLIIDTLAARAGLGMSIESRVVAIQSLASGVIASGVITPTIVDAVQSSLEDYTIDRRGDIGSLVRVAAIDAVTAASQHGVLDSSPAHEKLCTAVYRLAAEKLDKVRIRAWTCLQVIQQKEEVATTGFDAVGQVSSHDYFLHLLNLADRNHVRLSLLEGYISSAGAGSEPLLVSSRQALVDFAQQPQQSNRLLYGLSTDLLQVLRRNSSNDRIAVPALHVLAFLLFDTGLAERLDGFNWRDLFILVRKVHRKSSNLRKLLPAVRIYAGLLHRNGVGIDAMDVLVGLLDHRFAQIRNAVVDALWIATESESLMSVDWMSGDRGERCERLGEIKREFFERLSL